MSGSRPGIIHPIVYGISAINQKKRATDDVSAAPLLFTMPLYPLGLDLSIGFWKFDVSHIFTAELDENNCKISMKHKKLLSSLLTISF